MNKQNFKDIKELKEQYITEEEVNTVFNEAFKVNNTLKAIIKEYNKAAALYTLLYDYEMKNNPILSDQDIEDKFQDEIITYGHMDDIINYIYSSKDYYIKEQLKNGDITINEAAKQIFINLLKHYNEQCIKEAEKNETSPVIEVRRAIYKTQKTLYIYTEQVKGISPFKEE